MPHGSEPEVGSGNSLKEPLGVTLPILSVELSVNHRLPSGPAAID
jgi:hypothetical protein